jgi:hypothetical protein
MELTADSVEFHAEPAQSATAQPVAAQSVEAHGAETQPAKGR